jgi:hypothetical protein
MLTHSHARLAAHATHLPAACDAHLDHASVYSQYAEWKLKKNLHSRMVGGHANAARGLA